mmetsp:Transcript_16110/g.37349  ORF Transcript_16110/g.37349 Transcript_16110/m.37349 type:complete len:1772 (+) Transcript_16110:29-5344(+)|eukprot:CAMPEP_0197177390 /NCGR_PEP_ID=MMETSP1423-20130617/3006_1 /TAXON_ID=476441 /ORGANISM="Pseudo-nitzschia heimii, Strain UNC1101" /LENGTH=1771 /DNA_ID=CAMNT_0042626927 /DNA_START=36 /DNA_END=5351 /DNA_ORIENTATION=+
MGRDEGEEIMDVPITAHETEGSNSKAREQQSGGRDSPVRSLQSSKMALVDDVDESPRTDDSNRSLRSPASKDRDNIRSLEAHAQGMLRTMEDAKQALFTSSKFKVKKSTSEKSLGETHSNTSKLDEDGSNKETKPRSRTKKPEFRKREKTRDKSSSKSKTVDVIVSPIARAKGKIDSRLRRFRPNVMFSNNSEKESYAPKETNKDSSSKIDKRRRRQRPKELTPTDAVFEEPPKIEGETNTDTTHDENFDGMDDEESSMELKLTNDRDNSDKDQECDSSSSTASGSNTQKTEGGILENEKSDKVISASRYIFIGILGIAAVVIALSAFFMFRREDTNLFKNAFENQAEEMKLYTHHNVDSAFDTLKGLSYSTTSIIKRIENETGYPAGFINVPDIENNFGLVRETAHALVIAYMPRILPENFKRWEEYAMEYKGWIAKEQPGGPVDVEPDIMPYVWEYSDYDWEKRRQLDELSLTSTMDMGMVSENGNVTSNNGLRGRNSKPIERPGDCSGGQRRRERKLWERDLANIDDKSFVFADDYTFNNDDYVPEPSSQVPAPPGDDYRTPVWQISPMPLIDAEDPNVKIVNYNLADRLVFYKAVEYMENSRKPVFLDVCDQSSWFLIDKHKDILQTVVAFPVFSDFTDDAPIVGYYTAIIPWEEFFVNNLGPSSDEMIVVMNNTCGEVFSLMVRGGNATIISEEDSHDTDFTEDGITTDFAQDYNSKDFIKYDEEVCLYQMTVYPTRQFKHSHTGRQPVVYACSILMIFLFTTLAFMLFDCLVTRRQNKLLDTALRQNAIVNSLFPKNVQKKLMAEADATLEAAERQRNNKRRNLSTFLNDDQRSQERKVDPLDSKPIADLFPNTTIMFADISGFTAWSSAREPAAVFTLLETIYRAFDEIAKRRRVFKVEVVGDCYVAVCGLPDARKDHHAVMCRFAQDCMSAMHVHTKELEVRLGPDTGDLSLRVGLHSGPVVAGVLRGDKSRFQLFGDTMNTASRMESTGTPNRIQLSQATADLLILNGKEHWITKRQDKVMAKGKGSLTTYFLLSVKKKTSSTNSASTSKIDEVVLVRAPSHTKGVKTVQKRNRVADWVVEMLGKLLKEMKAKRKNSGVRPDSKATIEALENRSIGAVSSAGLNNKTVIDEVSDCLKLPGIITHDKGKGSSNKPSIPPPLAKEVIDELQHYVYSVASLYKKNPFHNFEHASHVSMSCIKLLNRIASHDEDHIDCTNHHTYGICSDPLISFGIVFSALIHDVDHCGVPNSQLVKEHSAVATMYKNKSVAEQNSIDIGWGLLMEPTYSNLRRHIYTNVSEYKCFRQIVVNCIMATDIVDKDLIKARNKRWDLAFSKSQTKNIPHLGSRRHLSHRDSQTNLQDIDPQTSFRKATVVIEHLIQLSDVSHTMQHWHMYRRWNERLFEESYKAYMEGRAEKNPIDNWYQGELGFYDFYIIPLAKKIKQCAVFGVSSDEYLSYAKANRQEWQERGKEVLDDMVKKVEATYHNGSNRQSRDLGTENGVVANRSTPENMKSSVSKNDGVRKGCIGQVTELENVAEDAVMTSSSEYEGSGDSDDQGEISEMNHSESAVEGSTDMPICAVDDNRDGKTVGLEGAQASADSSALTCGVCLGDGVKKELEIVLEESETNIDAENSSPEWSGVDDSCIENKQKLNDGGTEIEANGLDPVSEDDVSFKSAHSEESEGGKSGSDMQLEDPEVAAVSNRNESFKSIQSEVSGERDPNTESSSKDLEMGLDASDTDETSATTNSKASASEDKDSGTEPSP